MEAFLIKRLLTLKEDIEMYRSGIFNNPKNDDPEFKHQHQAEQRCRDESRNDDKEAYAVWDELDNTVYLWFDYEEFEPRN